MGKLIHNREEFRTGRYIEKSKLARAELGFKSAYFLRLLVDCLRLLVDRLRLRVDRLLERCVLRLRRLAARSPIDQLERLGEELAEKNAGDEKVSGDTLFAIRVVVEVRHSSA